MKTNERIQTYLQGMKQKLNLKKTIAAAIAGACIATGGIGFFQWNNLAEAAVPQHHFQGGRHYGINDDTIYQTIETRFKVDKKTLLDYQAKGWRPHELYRASFIAATKKVSLDEVLTEKTNKTWRDVDAKYGITPEQYRQSQQSYRAADLSQQLNVDEATVKKLMADGYRPRDIAMASAIAAKADKSITTVLSRKKINNQWFDVAAELGLSKEVYQECRQKAFDTFGAGHWGNGQYGNGFHNRGHY